MKKKYTFSIFILFVFTGLVFFNNCDRKEENTPLSLAEKITNIMESMEVAPQVQ